MTQITRLARLEALANAVTGARSGSKKDLVDSLDAGAEKMADVTFTGSWLLRASPIEIAFAAWHELGTGKRTQALWDKVGELAGGSGAVAKLFAGIQEGRYAA